MPIDDVEFIDVSVESYNKLVESQDILECLEAAGVNNWDGWDDAVGSAMLDSNTDLKISDASVEMKKITVDEYNKLIESSIILECLEASGVNSWDGWDDAMEMLD